MSDRTDASGARERIQSTPMGPVGGRAAKAAWPAAAAAIVAFALPAGAGAEGIDGFCPTAGNGPPKLVELQPVDSKVIKVARVAGSTANEADEWEMHLDAWLCVPGGTANHTVTAVKLQDFDSSGNLIRTRTPALQGDTIANKPNIGMDPLVLREPAAPNAGNAETGQYPYPLPAKTRVELRLESVVNGATETIARTFPVAEHRSPKGGYFAPFRQDDWTDPSYRWAELYHPSWNQQRWALDLRGARPTGPNSWSELKANATSPYADNEYVAYDMPIYSMSDGEVIACNNGTPDDTTGPFAGGNHIWVRTGREYVVYAHFRENSIPDYLCPGEEEELQKLADPVNDPPSDKPYQIEAGTLLGFVGDTGNSSHPHLHVHTQLGLPTPWGDAYSEWGLPADGRPINLMNTRVHPEASGWNDANASTIDPPAALPYFVRAEGDPCEQMVEIPFLEEEPKIEIPSECFPDVYNTMVYRGFRPVHIDVTEVGGSRSWTTIWRYSNEANWGFYYGLTEEQAEATIFGSSFEVLEVESYRAGGNVRYAVILVDNPDTPSQHVAVGETVAEWSQTHATQTSVGRWPVMMSVTEGGDDVAYITTVYQLADVGSNFVHAGLTNFDQAFTDNANAGRQLQWVESHVEDGVVRFSGLWYENLTGGYAASGQRDYDGIFDDYLTHTANGGFTRSLTGWHLNNQFSYRGLWRGPPIAQITGGPTGPTKKDKAELSFTLSDPFATARCKLDSKSWRLCTSPTLFKNLPDGKHTFKLRGIAREVIEGSEVQRTWKVK